MTGEADLRSACLTTDMANGSRGKEWIMVMQGHSFFPWSPLSSCLHIEASFLKND